MRLILVPGFTQTPSSWDGVRMHLPPNDFDDVTALEVRAGASFADTVDELAAEGGQAVWCGYSQGGRLALALALAHPHLVTTLVLVSASPGIADADERRARAASDEELAASIQRDGTEAFLARWLAQPLFADVPSDAPGVAERANTSATTLAHTLRTLGTGMMPSLWDRLGELTMPVVIVTGDADTKFNDIGDAMADRIPRGRRVRVPGGHAVPLVHPAALAAILHDITRPTASSNDRIS